MGGASKLLSSLLLTSSPLRLRPTTAAAALLLSPPAASSRRRLLLSPRSPLRTLSTSSAAAASSSSSSLPHGSSSASPAPPPRAPFPEWSRLVDRLAATGYASRAPSPADELALASGCGLSDGAEDAVTTCLAFARDRPDLLRSLPRKDVEVLVASTAPVLFKDGEASAQRLRRYLAGEETDVIVSERAETLDIVRYLLSYTYSSSDSYSEDKELTGSAVRNIMAELVSLTTFSQSSSFVESTPNSLNQHERFSRPPGQNIEMKRGDWICTRCSFMNFARNVRCLECNERRPKKMLTGGEWECPQCDFCNYGRNMSCLKCDCKRPASIPPNPSSASAGLGDVAQLLNATNVGKSEIERKLAENDEKAERWLSKVSQLDDSADLSSLAEDDDFPEIMPMRKGVNKFVVSTRKTPLDRRLANAQSSGNNATQTASSDSKISQTLDRILGRSKSAAASNSEPGSGNAVKKSTDHLSSIDPVPFVPLPADMFAKPQTNNGQGSLDGQINAEVDSSTANNSVPVPERRDDMEMESSDTAENWSNKVAELDNVNDVPSGTSDEHVPDIMPMRKGENRFVVSKKKDRSLTSPQYKRRSLLEQADNSDFVPFVPFPPGYFAKKDKPVESTADAGIVSEGSPASEKRFETNASSGKLGNSLNTSQMVGSQPKGYINNQDWNRNYSQQNSSSGGYGESSYQYQSQSNGARPSPSGTANTGSWNTGYSQGNFNESRGESTYHGSISAQQPYNSGYKNNNNSWSSENNNSSSAYTGNGNYNNNNAWSGNNSYKNNNAWSRNTSHNNSSSYNSNAWSSSHGYGNDGMWSNSGQSAWSSSNNQSGSFADSSNAASSSGSMNPNQTVHNPGYGGSSNRGYTGKSLEGSAVKDPDPLDMSEEAKAERWFRRAAQIKDISELANIPDEDFPEIMPMRKGVNRFVVSKRKTPLERRLTSPQYRRNLPIVSSEPEKDDS